MRSRAALLFLCSGLFLMLSAVLGLSLGSVHYNLSEIVGALKWILISGPEGDENEILCRVLLHVRLPRVLGAALAGCGLSVAGAVIQSVLRNPLASPNTVGINAGAGLFVLLVSAFLPVQRHLLPAAAFCGAFLTVALILTISYGAFMTPLAMILTGFAVSSIWNGLMTAIMILYPDAYVGAGAFIAGSLSGLTLDKLTVPLFFIGFGLMGSLVFCREMNILALGSDVAKSLGINLGRTRLLLILWAALLAGGAVSFAGLIGFVGLVVPHAVRFFTGSDHRLLVPLCALWGGSFVLLCDLFARLCFAPYELPVGIVMSFIGGPFFIALILRKGGSFHD